MATDTCQRKAIKLGQPGGAAPPEPERLPCPRCDSANTKFCYYNNYNLSQPRHFCKSCRRYWTHGGTLRDIPVGGGSRRNAKRCRTGTSAGAPFSTAQHDEFRHFPGAATAQFLGPLGAGSFTSLLNGYPAFGGFGLGDVGFGVGRATWPFSGVAEGGVNGGGGYTWQVENGESCSAGDGGGCFGWPDLGISTPGSGLK